MMTPQKGRPTMAVGMVIEIEGALWRCRSFGERIAVLETVGGPASSRLKVSICPSFFGIALDGNDSHRNATVIRPGSSVVGSAFSSPPMDLRQSLRLSPDNDWIGLPFSSSRPPAPSLSAKAAPLS